MGNKNLGERVKQLRKQREMTQTQLGEAVGVTYQNIQNLEAGGVNNPRYLTPLAELLGVTVDYLLNGKNEDNPSYKGLDAVLLSACMDAVISEAKAIGRELDTHQAAKLTAFVYAQSIKQTKPVVAHDTVRELLALMV